MPTTLPKFISPYLDHPLVRRIDPEELALLDGEELNNVIEAEDLIYRGLREYYKADKEKRLNSGHFGSSVQIARAWAFCDMAYPGCDLGDLVERVYKITKTTTKPQYYRNMRGSVIPRLVNNGLIKIDDATNKITDLMPYQIGSKLYIKRELLDVGALYYHQINQFSILNQIQNCPMLKNDLMRKNPNTFLRDYDALEEIDVIRTRSVNRRDFTLSKAYLTGERSLEAWNTILEYDDRQRRGLKSLLDLIGHLGGCVSKNEIALSLGRTPRQVGPLMRRLNKLGLAQRIQTLELEDALSRPIGGTRLNSNYSKLNNGQSILLLARSIPNAHSILDQVKKQNLFDEDELASEFDPDGEGYVDKVKNSLINIGVLIEADDVGGVWKVAEDNESGEFLDDVLKVISRTRSILGENIEIYKKLENAIPDNDEEIRQTCEQIQTDLMQFIDEESRK